MNVNATQLVLHEKRPASADSRRALCLSLAAERGWPAVEFRPGETIRAGGRAWGRFLRSLDLDPGAVTAAIEALEGMAPTDG